MRGTEKKWEIKEGRHASMCVHLPTSVTTENLWNVLREEASTAICCASSLVGDRIISIGATWV